MAVLLSAHGTKLHCRRTEVPARFPAPPRRVSLSTPPLNSLAPTGAARMRRTLPFAVVVLLACAFFALRAPGQASNSSGTPASSSQKLAGARPAIEAIDYSSIQAAIDALPAEGGVVRLPP